MFDSVPHNHVAIGGFWAARQALVRRVTIPYQWDALNDRISGADRSGSVRNLKIAAGKATGAFQGFFFQDSDVAKWIEAVAYGLETDRDPALERTADRLIDLIVAAQEEDGYLNTYYTIKESPDKRWTDLRDKHELYVSGHMLEAAIAYFRATGKATFLEAMIRNVDLIGRLFGRGKGQRRAYPGHPELELALVRLFEVTGNQRHLILAKYFIDERGTTPRYFDRETKRLGKKDFRSDEWYAMYNQSHLPIREQNEVVGHAVRACYLFAAAADVARETDDRQLFRAVKRLWLNATERRMYLTGGVGSTLLGEAFTFDYDLPNESAYTETCAAIGLMIWSQRMLRAELDSRYADVMERVLYNGFLAALSTDGTHCFYRNPLASVPDSNHPKRHQRRAWHECACCPPNVARFMMSLGGYIYSVRKQTVYVHQFVDSRASLQIGGKPVHLRQTTDYPWDGKITLQVKVDAPRRFSIAIRIPGWVRSHTLKVNGNDPDTQPKERAGYVVLNRVWTDGDQVTVDLPMPAERVYAHPKVRQNAGMVALQRGPVVYCLEQADNGPDLHEIVLPRAAAIRVRPEKTAWGSIPLAEAKGLRRKMPQKTDLLYATAGESYDDRTTIKAIPYFLWANRGMAEMTVWIREGGGIAKR